MPSPAHPVTFFVDLPLCRLHVMRTGDGPPLIMLPATISELEDYVQMSRFMGQWFTVYFFELPGHGGSQALQEGFSSHRLAEVVEQLVDHLGFSRFSLMGFSFGGILAMRIYRRLQARIDRLCLLAPCLTCRAMTISAIRNDFLRRFARLIDRPRVRKFLLGLFHQSWLAGIIGWIFRAMGRVEQNVPIKHKLMRMQESTLQVMGAQIEEIMTFELPPPPEKHSTPTFFVMSINDPMLDFNTTLSEAGQHFSNLIVLRLAYPFHQPPQPFTFEELQRDYRETLTAFIGPPVDPS